MLDLSDRHTPRTFEAPADLSASSVGDDIPVPGNLYRHYKGGLYQVQGLCTIEASQEQGVLYQALDPNARQDVWMRPLSDFSGPTRVGGMPRFSSLRHSTLEPLRHYLAQDVLNDSALQSILSRYDEPWRFFHARRHILDMFEKAQELGMELSAEQSLAILFHDIVYVPGAPEGQNERQSILLMQAFKGQVQRADTDWALVARIIEDTITHTPTTEASKAVLDLDIANLGDDPVHFCASDEMVWLENRHLLEAADARKDFDTRRLRFLLALANRGPLYHTSAPALEESARTNLEGLRQAWVQKYGPTR